MMKTSLSFGAVLLGTCLAALAEPPARSLDQALTSTLSLGNASGCGPGFGLPELDQLSLDTLLVSLRNSGQIGKEIAAICGSSAVTSSSALGGSLGSLQTTKTVSQFRLARSRTDSRLDPRGKRAGLDGPILLAQLGGNPLAALSPDSEPAGDLGPGVFMQVTHERRSRVGTALEAGYRGNAGEALIGVDYATRNRWLVGAWLGWRDADADYRSTSALIGGADPAFGNSLTPALLSDICRVGPGGGFDDNGARYGGFVAKRFDDAFIDAAAQYSRRNHAYQRNVCATEGFGAIIRDPNNPGQFLRDGGNGGVLDDIYAGTIFGKARLTEWGVSVRAGFDVNADPFQWGPRLSLTYLRTTVGAYVESGRTSVTNRVESNNPAVLFTDRAAGDPTGLELAFDAQRRVSLQSELQLVAAYRLQTGVGTWVPRASIAWQHEFDGERRAVTVRMAQDRRAAPTRFNFTTDSSDKNKGTVGLGLSFVQGEQLTADLAVSRLVGDSRFDSTQVAVQAHWRF